VTDAPKVRRVRDLTRSRRLGHRCYSLRKQTDPRASRDPCRGVERHSDTPQDEFVCEISP
jgi:hypothetical protein